MKKLLLLLSSAIAVFALFAIPVACSHYEEGKDTNKADKVLHEFQGSVKYADAVTDSAVACLTDKADGSIELTLSTGLPLYQFSFGDVNVSLQGDTSVLRAQNQTIDAGNDAQFTLVLKGFLKDKTLFLEITGNELTAPLLFSTEVALLHKQEEEECQADGPSATDLELYNGHWEGNISIDGSGNNWTDFTSTLSENGEFSLYFGLLEYSANLQPFKLSLEEMCFFSAKDDVKAFTFGGNIAKCTMNGVITDVPAVIDGYCEKNGLLFMKMEMTIDGAKHTIVLDEARKTE